MNQVSTTAPRGLLRLRRAEPSDLGDLGTVSRAANAQYRVLVPTEIFERYLDDLRAMNADTEHVIVAERDGRLVGSVRFVPPAAPGGPAGIRALAVHPLDRGAGIAKRLVGAAERIAMRHGARELHLHTSAFMRSAVGLYERLGYRRDPARDIEAIALYPDLDGASEFNLLAYRRELITNGKTRK